MKRRFKTEKKRAYFSFGRLMVLVYSCVFILIGCLKEEVNTNRPKSGPEQFQLHNFNAPLSGGSLEGSAPDIHYFRQKEDGSYVFMLTSLQYEGFETKWATDYVLVTTDSRGIIQKSEVIKFPVKEGIRGNFTYAFGYGTPPPESPLALEEFYFRTAAISPNYVADDKSVIYYTPDNKCGCRNLFFNLHPETGQSEYVTTGPFIPLPQVFRTSDGGFITIGGADAPDYHKFSALGTLEFKQPMK